MWNQFWETGGCSVPAWSVLSGQNDSLLGCEWAFVPRLMSHIPYKIGSQVTQKGLPILPNVPVPLPLLFLIAGKCCPLSLCGNPSEVLWTGACWQWLGCCPHRPTAAEPSQVVPLQAIVGSSQWVGWWTPKDTVTICLWKTQDAKEEESEDVILPLTPIWRSL